MNGKEINKVDSTKFHILPPSNTIAQNVGLISKLKYILPQPFLKTLYQSFIVPYLSYCSIIWFGTSNETLNRLFILQKPAISHIAQAYYRDRTSSLFRIFNLLKVKDLVKENVACFANKASNHTIPSSLTIFFHRNNEVHSCSTRLANHIHNHPWRTKFGPLACEHMPSMFRIPLPLQFQRLRFTLLLKRKLIQQSIMEY